jgi:hypothetical protein
MKTKKFTHGITFFTDLAMYQILKDITDSKKIGLSKLLRELIQSYFESQGISKKANIQ